MKASGQGFDHKLYSHEISPLESASEPPHHLLNQWCRHDPRPLLAAGVDDCNCRHQRGIWQRDCTLHLPTCSSRPCNHGPPSWASPAVYLKDFRSLQLEGSTAERIARDDCSCMEVRARTSAGCMMAPGVSDISEHLELQMHGAPFTMKYTATTL